MLFVDCWISFIINFLKKIFQKYQEDVKQFVSGFGLDLGPNCLPKLSADDTSRQRVKVGLRRQNIISLDIIV